MSDNANIYVSDIDHDVNGMVLVLTGTASVTVNSLIGDPVTGSQPVRITMQIASGSTSRENAQFQILKGETWHPAAGWVLAVTPFPHNTEVHQEIDLWLDAKNTGQRLNALAHAAKTLITPRLLALVTDQFAGPTATAWPDEVEGWSEKWSQA